MGSQRFSAWAGSDTPAVFGLLVIMAVFFVVGFFGGLTDDLISWLAWPVGPQWLLHLRFWQMLTFPFVHPSFWSLVFDGMVVFFFGSPLERAWGTARFLSFFFLTGIVAGFTILALTFLVPGLPGAYFIGSTGHFVGLGIAYGALNPYARVYLYMVLPIEARWLGLISAALELFLNWGSYGSIAGALAAIVVSALFAWFFTTGVRFGPRGGGPGIKDRFERWRQRQRMRMWQRKVSKIDKPEDLFKGR